MNSKQTQDQELLQDVAETSYLMDLDKLDKYEKDVRKTVLLYHGNNEFDSEREVAEELNVSRNTVHRRLKSDEAKSFMKMFSHKDDDEFDRWLEDLAARHFNLAIKGLRTALKRAREDDDVSPQVLTNASTSLLKADNQFFKNLQEIGAKKKPKERKEIQDSTGSGDDLMKRMQEAQKQLSEANSSENQEKEEDKEQVES